MGNIPVGDVSAIKKKEPETLPCIGEGCVRCCTDRGNPLELTTGDILRLCRELSIGAGDFYSKYCGIIWNRIAGTCLFIPSVGLIFPCRFLESDRCAIYDVRPIHCRLFPEGLVANNSNVDIYRNCGYRCIEKGIKPTMVNKPYIHRLKDIDSQELKITASYFENFKYCVEMREKEFEEIGNLLTNVNYVEKAAKERDICTEIINKKDRGRAESIFMKKLNKIKGKNQGTDDNYLLSLSKSFGFFA